MSVPTPKASDAKSDLRAITITLEKNAPLRIVKELMKNTGLLSVEGNFEFVDFAADCPSPIPMWTGGCQFRVPPAPLAGDEPKPSPHLTLSLDKQQMDFSSQCLDYVDFRWPEGVEVFAAAHPFDDITEEEGSSFPDSQRIRTVSSPAVACIIPTSPGQLVLNLEFGRSYFLSVDPKFVHPSDPSTPAETPYIQFQSSIAQNLHLVPPVNTFTSHVVPFTSGPGQVPGWSEHPSDRPDHWGYTPFWWFAETSSSQWERPCMLLPATNLYPLINVVLPGLSRDTPAPDVGSLHSDYTFSFASPDEHFIFAEFHIVQMSCRVVLVQEDENGGGSNITSDFLGAGSEIKVVFSPYNTSPDTYEDFAAVSVVPQLDGSSLIAQFTGNFCCRYVRIRVIVTSPPFGGANALVLLRDVKFCGEAMWKRGDWIGAAVDRALTICRDDPSLGYRKSQNEDFTWLTYSNLTDRINALKRMFAHYDKDGIAVLVPCVNCIDVIAVKLACYMTGNTVIPVSSPVETRILEHYLNQTRPVVVFFDFAFAKKICSLVLKGEFVFASFPFVKHWLYCIPENIEHGTEAFATDISAPFQLWTDCSLTLPHNDAHPDVSFKDVAHRDCFIFYTSGSTGLPKGVPRSFEELEEYMNTYSDAVKSVHLAAMPLSHMSEGTSFIVSLIRGNRVALPIMRFADSTGLTILDQFSDFERLKPTYVSSVPRIFEIVQRMFFDEVASLTSEGVESSAARATVTSLYRNGKIFGKNLRGMFWGSAPISPQLEQFLREVWGAPNGPLSMSQGYGSSECGTITADMIAVPNIVALLIESEDSGPSLDIYRGEVVVHTLSVAKSYLHAPENPSFIDNINLDVQGPLFGDSWTQLLAVSPFLVSSKDKTRARFFCTGDLGESSADPPQSEIERATSRGQVPAKPSQVVTLDSSWGKHSGRRAMLVPAGCKLNVVGRLKNVVKMPNGEFVAPEYIEGCLAKADIVEQICVIARSSHSFVVAVIVPKDLTVCEVENAQSTIMRALVLAAQQHALPSYMIPRQIYISNERWSASNGMMTHNEKLNRAGIFQHYAAVVDGLFASGESGAPDAVAESENVAESEISLGSVLRVIKSVSRSALNATASTDISSPEVLGGDSLTIVILISKLNSIFRLKLSPAILFELKTVNDLVNYMIKAQSSSSVISRTTSSSLLHDLYDATLAQFISEAAGRSSQEVVSSAVSAADAPSNSYLTEESSVAEHLSQCKNIFLSGVTGFLGCHLLQDLMENSSANVHCLVRASSGSQTDAKHRLDSCLRKYKVALTLEQLARVHVHNGDLSLPLFGLPEDQFMQLSQLLDVVVHNGAHVNWLMTYAQLRPANVLGTATALQLALIGRRKCFVHISTLSVSAMQSNESAALSPQLCLSAGQGGYTQSKFIAERLVRAASLQGLPVTIIRPGVIAGHTKTGAANRTDYVPSILAAFARTGEYVASDGFFDLNPVDMVARASVLLSLQPASKDLRVFHLVAAGKANYRQVGQAAAGDVGRELSFSEFKTNLVKRIDSGVAENGAESMKPFVSFLETDSFFAVQQPYRSEASVAAMEQLGLVWQCDSLACVRGIVSFLTQPSGEE